MLYFIWCTVRDMTWIIACALWMCVKALRVRNKAEGDKCSGEMDGTSRFGLALARTFSDSASQNTRLCKFESRHCCSSLFYDHRV